MSTKIDQMKHAAKEFVDEIHIDQAHTGRINTFDSSVHLGPPETSSYPLKSQIADLSSGGTTALFDSVYHSINELANAHYRADRHGRPMAVLTLTDGKDVGSNKHLRDVRRLIRERNFVPNNNCYFFIAGVDDASEREMKEMCRGGYGAYIDANSINAIFKTFKKELTSRIVRKKTTIGKRSDGKIVRVTTKDPGMCIKKLDYALNLDCSSSMG
jgi:hypothetical protein